MCRGYIVILQLPGHTQADCEASVCACTGSVWGRDRASVGARDNLSHFGGFPEIKERGSSIPAWAFHEREARRLEGKIGRQGCQCAIIPIHTGSGACYPTLESKSGRVQGACQWIV